MLFVSNLCNLTHLACLGQWIRQDPKSNKKDHRLTETDGAVYR